MPGGQKKLATDKCGNYAWPAMAEQRSTHARVSVNPASGDVESQKLDVVSEAATEGPHNLLFLDLQKALDKLEELDDLDDLEDTDEPPAA